MLFNSSLTSSINLGYRPCMWYRTWDKMWLTRCITVRLVLLFRGWGHFRCLFFPPKRKCWNSFKILTWNSANLNCYLKLPKANQLRGKRNWRTRNKHISTSWKTILYTKNLESLTLEHSIFEQQFSSLFFKYQQKLYEHEIKF